MRHAELFYSGQICILFLDLPRGSLHRYSRMKVFVTCGGTQLCQINVVNFWDSPLAQSQSLRPPEWWSHKGVSVEAHDMAVRRMVQAGAVPITWLALSGEWQRDWARESTLADAAKILTEHGGGSGVAFAWETQLLGTSKR